MPKPLFTKLVAQAAIGFFCVIFGCIFSIQTKDSILFAMSFILGICSMIRTVTFFQLIKKKNYIVIEGCCRNKELSMFGKHQHILFFDTNEQEYHFTFSKDAKLLQGHLYRLYFRRNPDTNIPLPQTTDHLLAYEELSALTETKMLS